MAEIVSRRDTTPEYAPSVSEAREFRILWPLVLVVLVEASTLIWLLRTDAGAPFTRFSLAVAALCVVVGIAPALLRPTAQTVLAGCIAVVLAGFIVIPFAPERLPPLPEGMTLMIAPSALLLRLLNGFALAPLTLHFVARFPHGYPQRVCRAPATQTLVAAYATTAALSAGLLLSSSVNVRVVTLLLLVGWSIALLVRAGRRLICISREANPEHRRAAQQARLLLLGVFVATLPVTMRLLAAFDVQVSYDAIVLTQLILPATMTYTIMRHDLFGIDAALRRALAYAVLSLLLLALYFALSMVTTMLLAQTWSDFRGLAVIVGVGAAALAFTPLSRRAQHWVDAALYPDRLVFQDAVANAGSRLSRVVDRDEVLTLLTEELPENIGATWASLSLHPAPEVPAPNVTPAWNAQLMVGGTVLGRYWLGPRQAGPSYDADEEAQLQALVQQAALALAYADTIADLRTLNRELELRVAERTGQVMEQQRALAAHEERQRLARDLHDSITQTLFSITLSLGAIRKQMQADPLTAADNLAEQEVATQRALGEMRDLLAQLRGESPASQPATLDVVLLLEHYCVDVERRLTFSVTRDLPETLPVPADIAHNLLHVAREALHNAVKHSGVATAACRLRRRGDDVVLTIVDTGTGIAAGVDAGYGLRGMRERVAACGGTLTIESEPGAGTTVRARIPAPASNIQDEAP